MGEYWFDATHVNVLSGAVLTVEQATRHAGDPLLHRIGALAVAPEFPYTRAHFGAEAFAERREAMASWRADECRSFGLWAVGLVEAEGRETNPFTSTHLRRLDALGLGIGKTALLNRSGAATMADFRRMIGAPVGKEIRRYAEWGVQDYAEFARAFAAELGRKPEDVDYAARAVRGEGPGLAIIRTSPVKSITRLNELAGFPDVGAMTLEDKVYWGATVRRANAGRPISERIIDVLSGRRRGPSSKTIRDDFGSLRAFAEQVDERYELEVRTAEEERKRKLELYANMIAAGELPEAAGVLTEEMLFALGAQHLVLRELAPDLTEKERKKVIGGTTSSFMSKLLRVRVLLEPWQIEHAALELGVFDDIWPLDDIRYFEVAEAELQAARDRKAASARARHAARRAAPSKTGVGVSKVTSEINKNSV